jgi:peptidoglycan-N-acetylglucosamine deacetylase
VTDADRQPPLGDWLQGAAAVAILSFDVDAEAPILAEGEHYAEDLSAMSHQAYGPRVGVPASSSSSPRMRSRPPSSCPA